MVNNNGHDDDREALARANQAWQARTNPSVAARYRHELEGQVAEDARKLDRYLKTGAQTGARELQTVS